MHLYGGRSELFITKHRLAVSPAEHLGWSRFVRLGRARVLEAHGLWAVRALAPESRSLPLGPNGITEYFLRACHVPALNRRAVFPMLVIFTSIL